MTLPPIVKQPHYVWRYYLAAWEVEGKLTAFRNGKVFTAVAGKVAKESGFHDLRAITHDDEAFLRAMMIRPGSPSESTNSWFIQSLVVMRRACDIVLSNESSSDDAKEFANYTLKNFEETIQGNLEILAIPWLDSLRRADASFIRLRENRLYYYFLTMQYFRTKRMMTKMVDAFMTFDEGKHAPRIERVWQLMRHLFTVNVSGSLFADRTKYRTIFLRSGDGLPFITGAQPIVNTYRT